MKVACALLSSLSLASAFTAPARPLTISSGVSRPDDWLRHNSMIHIYNKPLMMASSGSDGSKKRRKRKDGKQFTPPANAPAVTTTTEAAVADQSAPLSPKENTVVVQVRDIRDVLSGDEPKPANEDDEILGEDEEWEYYDDDDEEDEKSSVSNIPGRMQDDSMEQLLADARKMRASTAKNMEEEKEKSISDTVFEVISTIVTIDFFVVIGLLVWFLAGIFCSTVLKNDAVQIAFNMNFEKVTQPALGILMIGSVAGALGNKDKEEK